MIVNGNTNIAALLRRHPDCEDVLGWHGIGLTDAHRGLTVNGLCWVSGVNTEQVLRDLRAAVRSMSDALWSGELAEHIAEHERTYDDIFDETWRETSTYGGLGELGPLLDTAGA